MGVVIYKLDGKPARWLVRDTSKDFHTQHGAIPSKKLKPGKLRMKGHVFAIVNATYLDEMKGMKRKAQIITRKDVGFMIGWCGLTKNSIVVESGAGSGGATLALAGVCKHVYSYEIEPSHAEVVRENLLRMKIKNVTLFEKDFKKCTNHDADFLLLDLPEPWEVYRQIKKTLQAGGYLVVYTPTIVQAQRFVQEAPDWLLHERTLELIDRDWKLKDQAIRPVNAPIGHTAFLTICRKLQ